MGRKVWKYGNGVLVYDSDFHEILDLMHSNTVQFSHAADGFIKTYNAESCGKYLKNIYKNIECVNNVYSDYSEHISSELLRKIEFENNDIRHLQFAILIDSDFDKISDINSTVFNLFGWIPCAVRFAYCDFGKNNIPISGFFKFEEFDDFQNGISTNESEAIKKLFDCFDINYIEIYYVI